MPKLQSTIIQWSKNSYIIDNMLIYFEHLMKKFGGFYPKKSFQISHSWIAQGFEKGCFSFLNICQENYVFMFLCMRCLYLQFSSPTHLFENAKHISIPFHIWRVKHFGQNNMRRVMRFITYASTRLMFSYVLVCPCVVGLSVIIFKALRKIAFQKTFSNL